MHSKRYMPPTALAGMLILVLTVGTMVAVYPLQAQSATDLLTDDEVAGLQFMREEEKLARDVYRVLDDLWNLRAFENIGRAEQAHMDAVATLLDRYAIEDPTVGNEIGVFTDADLQALYDELVEIGSRSMSDALRIGAAIEEIDILDLEERLVETNNREILQVYENLLRGSSNHLRAFVSNLERRTGETYEPQYMDGPAYEEIISASHANRNGVIGRDGGQSRWGQGPRGYGRQQ